MALIELHAETLMMEMRMAAFGFGSDERLDFDASYVLRQGG